MDPALSAGLHEGLGARRAPEDVEGRRSGAPASAAPPDLLNPRAILLAHGIRANKRLGQHFLMDRSYLAAIVAAAEVRNTDSVLEIGPGLGVLTDALALRAGRVLAVELDAAMRLVLSSTVRNHANVTIVAGDFLAMPPEDVVGASEAPDGRLEGYKVVANLPYQITSAALRHTLEARVRPELAVVMVQREVAERILAVPDDMSILAVAVQFYARPSRVATVPAGAFYPRPKVDSVVLRLDVHDQPPVDVAEPALFFRVVRAGFSQKRKQLRNSVASGLQISTGLAAEVLAAAGIDSRRRAETLSLAEWAVLTRAVAERQAGP